MKNQDNDYQGAISGATVVITNKLRFDIDKVALAESLIAVLKGYGINDYCVELSIILKDGKD
jgi:hypothetical protein